MPMRKKYNRKKRNYKSKRRYKKKSKYNKTPAGNTLTRSFSYPQGGGIYVQGVVPGGGVTVSQTNFVHSMVNVGASDASIFLKYYQWFRIKKVYLTFQTITDKITQVLNTSAIPTPYAGQGNCQILLIPWRDGIAFPSWVGSSAYVQKLIEKYRQQRGVKFFLRPLEQLKKGFTISYKPNTLNVGFETTGGVTGMTYHNYTPNYDKWIGNNDEATDFYGYSCVIFQAGASPISIQIKQSITVQYKEKCNDPLITITPNEEDLFTRAMKMTAVHLNGHALNHPDVDTDEYCSRSSNGAMANENANTPETIDLGLDNPPTHE